MSAAATEEKSGHSEAAPAAAAPAGGGSKLVLILTLVNVLVTLAMVGVLFMSFQRDKKAPSVEDIAANEGEHGGGGEHGAPAGEHGGGGGHGEAKSDGGKKHAGNFGKMVALDQFTVNLSTPGSMTPKYVRVNISLEMPNDDAEHEVTLKMPQVRNTIIDLFNSKRPSDLANAEGRDYLKEEIRNALNGFLVSGKAKGVFFTNFAVAN